MAKKWITHHAKAGRYKKRVWKQRHKISRKQNFGSHHERIDLRVPYRIEYSTDNKNWHPSLVGYIDQHDFDNTLKRVKTETIAPYWKIIRKPIRQS